MPIAREIITPKNEMLNVSRNLNLPHSPGIRAGDLIFLSNMAHMLESAGSSLECVVKINVLLYDMLEFENMNAVYRQFFRRTHRPAPPAACS